MLGLQVATERAGAAELLGVDFAGTIYDVAVPLGTASNPRSTGIATLSGLAMSPSGVIYSHDAATNHLYRINPLTGQATEIGFLGLDATEGDLAFHPQTGVLYGAQTAGADRLYTIDPSTGQTTIVGSIVQSGDISAMAFDASGTLWALDTSANQSLYSLDPSSAAILSTIPLVGDFLGNTAGMDFDPVTGRLFVSARNGFSSEGPSFFYWLTMDGTLNVLGETGLPQGYSGLRFIPEPGTIFPVVLGVVAIFARRRRTGRN